MCFWDFLSPSIILNIVDHLHFIKPIQHLNIDGSWYTDTLDIVNLEISNTGKDFVNLLLKKSIGLDSDFIKLSNDSIKPNSRIKVALYFPPNVTDALISFKDGNSKKYLIIYVTKQDGKWKFRRGLLNRDYVEIEQA